MDDGGVEFANVSFALPDGRVLLDGVSFRCEPGSTTALLGRSGSGKTTLLRTVNGLVTPTGGRVIVHGEDVAETDVHKLRRTVGYVIQESGLFPHLTVERNIAMPLELRGEGGASRQLAAAQVLERVGLPADLLTRYPWQLSGGQRQRVGVARALIAAPKILLMDEPFGALDPLTRAEIQATVHELLRESGMTTLIVTHDLPEALFLADRVVLLEGGRRVAEIAADAFMGASEPGVQAYVRATQPRAHAGAGTGAG